MRKGYKKAESVKKYKIQRIHGESQCLFRRKIATRWLSRWSRQLPQHQPELSFCKFLIHKKSINHLVEMKITIPIMKFVTDFLQEKWKWRQTLLGDVFTREEKVKVKANIIRGCLTQGSLAMAAPLRGEGSQDLLLRYKRASQGYNAN